MNTTIVLACVGFAWTAFCLLIADWITSTDRRIAHRVRSTSGRDTGRTHESSVLFRDWDLAINGQQTLVSRLQTAVEQSGLPVRLRDVMVYSGWCALAAAALGAAWSGWGMTLAIPSATIPALVVMVSRQRRIRRMQLQLPEAFDVMRRAVEAGQTVASAFQQVTTQSPPPLAGEFALCGEQQNLGLSHDAALRDLARRVPLVEIRMLVVALILQRQSGGSPSEILNNMADLIRKRLRLTRRVQALTAEGRTQALVLTLLPILAFVGLLIIEPGYVAPLLERPSVLGVMAGLEVVGALWVQQTIRLEY